MPFTIPSRESVKESVQPTANKRMSPVGSRGSDVSEFIHNTTEEIMHFIQRSDGEIRRYSCENEIFEKYIARIQPASLTNMKRYLESASAIAQRVQTMASSRSSSVAKSSNSSVRYGESVSLSPSQSQYRSTIKHATSSVIQSRITYAMRIDMVMSLMEEMRLSVEQFINEFRVLKFRYNSEIEEKELALKEIKSARTTLEQSVVGEGTDWTGSRIPAEKFLKNITDLLKLYDQKIGKMRLKLVKLKTQLRRVKVQLVQNLELGESVQPTDLDELKIENKEFALDLEQKNVQVLELKKVTGICCGNLFVKQRCLEELSDKLKKLLVEIKQYEKISDKLEMDEGKTMVEIKSAEKQLSITKDLTSQFVSPNVLDYIQNKAELKEVEKNIKIWKRRISVQENTIYLLKCQLKSACPKDFKTMFKSESQVNTNLPAYFRIRTNSVLSENNTSSSKSAGRSVSPFGVINRTP